LFCPHHLGRVSFFTLQEANRNAWKFPKTLDSCTVQSFSAKTHPYDNAAAERFFKFLKWEEIRPESYASNAHLTPDERDNLWDDFSFG
jgi:transposase InsO family protein